jgi:alcohol dehydrogenase class IV
MNIPSGEYRFGRIERIVFGAGKVAGLADETERRDLRRAVVITGKTLGRSKLLGKVTSPLANRLAGVFTDTQQHVPSRTVQDAIDFAMDRDADCLVSFGGGSPIDTAKAVAMAFLTGRRSLQSGEIGLRRTNPERGDLAGREIVHIAIPTTLSAGEFTAFAGITDEKTKIKGGVGDARLQARTIILDPELTTETPGWLWACTAIRALDHAVESSYSVRHQIYTDTLASKAIELITSSLLPSMQTQGADELAHRSLCQLAAWFSIAGAGNGMGLSHALGHQIGARWDVPHGITSCITLPHVMRFMADIAPEGFAAIAQGLGIRFDPASPHLGALECADRVARFISRLELRNRLSQFDISRDEIFSIVDPVMREINHARTTPRPVTRSEIELLLQAAY